jgi:hypothetical protein
MRGKQLANREIRKTIKETKTKTRKNKHSL